jgi:hypothetical protein
LKIPPNTKLAIEYLIRTAQAEGVAVAGFAFGTAPFIINFGNCKDWDDPKLYESLCKLAKRERDAGRALSEPVQEVN